MAVDVVIKHAFDVTNTSGAGDAKDKAMENIKTLDLTKTMQDYAKNQIAAKIADSEGESIHC